MATNQTHIISVSAAPASPPGGLDTAVNNFITSGIARGYINFQILPVVVVAQMTTAGDTTAFNYTVQINYYDPSIM